MLSQNLVQGWVKTWSKYVAQQNWTKFWLKKWCFFCLFFCSFFFKISFSLQKEEDFWKTKKEKKEKTWTKFWLKKRLFLPPFPKGVQKWPRFAYTLEMGVFEISASSAWSPETTIKIGVLGCHRNFGVCALLFLWCVFLKTIIFRKQKIKLKRKMANRWGRRIRRRRRRRRRTRLKRKKENINNVTRWEETRPRWW